MCIPTRNILNACCVLSLPDLTSKRMYGIKKLDAITIYPVVGLGYLTVKVSLICDVNHILIIVK